MNMKKLLLIGGLALGAYLLWKRSQGAAQTAPGVSLDYFQTLEPNPKASSAANATIAAAGAIGAPVATPLPGVLNAGIIAAENYTGNGGGMYASSTAANVPTAYTQANNWTPAQVAQGYIVTRV